MSEMVETPSANNAVWRLSNWPISWRLIVVMMIPLLLAGTLGGLRISSAINEYTKTRAEATRVAALPRALELYAAAVVLGSAQIPKAVVPEVTARADRAIEDADAMTGDLDPDIRSTTQTMLETARTIRSGGNSVAGSVKDLVDRLHSLQHDALSIVDATIEPIDSPAVQASSKRLTGIQTARMLLLDEAVAFLLAQQSSAYPRNEYIEKHGAAMATLEQLGREYPSDDARIAELLTLERDRGRMNLATTSPVELRDKAVQSSNVFTALSNQESDDIVQAVQDRSSAARTSAIRDAIIVVLALLAAVILTALIIRSITRPLRSLQRAAQRIAETDLPDEVGRIRAGENADQVHPQGVPVHSHEEVGQVARAVDAIHGRALELAGEQASLRIQVNGMFETLARRNRGLVDRQLELIDALEQDEKDPASLDRLFALDHLAARMRRISDNLLILADKGRRSSATASMPIGDVLGAAMSEVEEYQRIRVVGSRSDLLAEPAATDIAHLVAELFDNALRASPPDTEVVCTIAETHEHGLVIEVADRGVGVAPADLDEINSEIERTADPSADTTRRMGLFVVSRLAQRHGVGVRLRPTIANARHPGVTATVSVPPTLIVTPIREQVDRSPSAPQATTDQDGPQQPVLADHEAAELTASPAPNGNVIVNVPLSYAGRSEPPKQAQLPRRRPQQQPHSPAPVPAGDQGPGSAELDVRESSHGGAPLEDTPIYDAVVSGWFGSSTSASDPASRRFESAADAGWTAARHAVQAAPVDEAPSGLPRRTPGRRLVPGAIDGARPPGGRHDPQAIRASLSRHQQGVQEGRAHRTARKDDQR